MRDISFDMVESFDYFHDKFDGSVQEWLDIFDDILKDHGDDVYGSFNIDNHHTLSCETPQGQIVSGDELENLSDGTEKKLKSWKKHFECIGKHHGFDCLVRPNPNTYDLINFYIPVEEEDEEEDGDYGVRKFKINGDRY